MVSSPENTPRPERTPAIPNPATPDSAANGILAPERQQEIKAIMREYGQMVAEAISREDIARTAAEATDARMKTIASKISRISIATGAAGTLAGIFANDIDTAVAGTALGAVGGKQIATAAYTVAAATKAIVTAYYSAKATTAVRRTGDLTEARKALGLSSQEEASTDTAANEAPESEVTTRARLIIDRASQTNASLDKIEGSKYGLGANESIKKLGNEEQRSAINAELKNFYASYKSAENDEARAAATKAFNNRIDELNKSGAFGSKGQRTSAVSSFLIGDHGDSIVSTRSIKKAAEDLVKDLAEKDIKSDDFAEYLNSDDGKNSFNIYEASLKRDVETRQAVDNVAAAVALGGVFGGVTFAALARDARIKSRSFLGASVSRMVANTVTSGVFGGVRGFSKARRLISEAELRDIRQDQSSTQPARPQSAETQSSEGHPANDVVESQSARSNSDKRPGLMRSTANLAQSAFNAYGKAKRRLIGESQALQAINEKRGRKNIQDIYDELDRDTMLVQLYQSDNKLETFKELQKNNPDALKKMFNGLATDDALDTLSRRYGIDQKKNGSKKARGENRDRYNAALKNQNYPEFKKELDSIFGKDNDAQSKFILERLLNSKNSDKVKTRLLDTLADLEARDQVSSRRKIDLIRWGKDGASKGRLGLTERIIKAQDLLGDYDHAIYEKNILAKSDKMEEAQRAVDRERNKLILKEATAGLVEGVVVGSVITLVITNAKKLLTYGMGKLSAIGGTANAVGYTQDHGGRKPFGPNTGDTEPKGAAGNPEWSPEKDKLADHDKPVLFGQDDKGNFVVGVDRDGDGKLSPREYLRDSGSNQYINANLADDNTYATIRKELKSQFGIELERNQVETSAYRNMNVGTYLEQTGRTVDGYKGIDLKNSATKVTFDKPQPLVVNDGPSQYRVEIWGKGGEVPEGDQFYVDVDGPGPAKPLAFDIDRSDSKHIFAAIPAELVDNNGNIYGTPIVGRMGDNGLLIAHASSPGVNLSLDSDIRALTQTTSYAFTSSYNENGQKILTGQFAVAADNSGAIIDDNINMSEIYNGVNADGRLPYMFGAEGDSSRAIYSVTLGDENGTTVSIPQYRGGYMEQFDSGFNSAFKAGPSAIGTPLYGDIDGNGVLDSYEKSTYIQQILIRNCTESHMLAQNASAYGLFKPDKLDKLGISEELLKEWGIKDGTVDSVSDVNILMNNLEKPQYRNLWDNLANATNRETVDRLNGCDLKLSTVNGRISTYNNPNGDLSTSSARGNRTVVSVVDKDGNKIKITEGPIAKELESKNGGKPVYDENIVECGGQQYTTPKPKVTPPPKTSITPPPADKPPVDEPTGIEPTGDESTGIEPTGDESTGIEPTGDEPTGDEPTGIEPTGDEPTGIESTGDESTGGDDSGTDVPIPKDAANMTRIEEQISKDIAQDIDTGEVRVHQTTEIEETPTAAPTAEEYVGTAPDIVQNDASTKAESITVSKPDLGGVTMPTDISPENDYTRDLGGTHDNVDVGRVPNVTDQEDLEAIRIADENEIKYEDAPTTGKDAWESIFNTEGNNLTNNNADTGGNDMADSNIDTEINDAANSKAA